MASSKPGEPAEHPLKIRDETEFDLRMRVELAMACDPGEAPPHLFLESPRVPINRRRALLGLGALGLFGAGTGAVYAMLPHALVRSAIEHEYYERTLRGQFMDGKVLLKHLGLEQDRPVPGFSQLLRRCEIDGYTAYHLTTFFEKGGMVTVFAFDQPVTLPEDSGWWSSVYWQSLRSKAGKPLILVSEKKRALAIALRFLSGDAPAYPAA